MYTALEQSVNSTGALAGYPGFTITDIMRSWIEQAGHPLLYVSIDYNNGTVTLTQVQNPILLSTVFCFRVIWYLFEYYS